MVQNSTQGNMINMKLIEVNSVIRFKAFLPSFFPSGLKTYKVVSLCQKTTVNMVKVKLNRKYPLHIQDCNAWLALAHVACELDNQYFIHFIHHLHVILTCLKQLTEAAS